MQAQRPKAAAAQPEGPRYTLTIRGFNLAGAPDNGDQVQVFSATSIKWDENTIGPIPIFRHGLVTLHVPAGKYWLIGQFLHGNSLRLDIPAQVTVTGSTTATVSEGTVEHCGGDEVIRPRSPTNRAFSWKTH